MYVYNIKYYIRNVILRVMCFCSFETFKIIFCVWYTWLNIKFFLVIVYTNHITLIMDHKVTLG